MTKSKINNQTRATNVAPLSNDLAVIEYNEIGENLRYWGNLRFVSMTVFVGVMAGLLSALFQWSAAMTLVSRLTIRVGGVVGTILFWIMDERILQYWKHILERGITLEKILGFLQYTNYPKRRFLTSGNAVRILYLIFFAFWVVTLIWFYQF